MEQITGITRGGAEWVPEFVIEINQVTCIGCGRCYKVCPRNVFELIDRPEELRVDDYDDDDDDDYDDDEDGSDAMVMAITNPMDCIGCTSCGRVCPKKNCLSYAPQPIPETQAA